MPYVYVELSELESSDLVSELESRGYVVAKEETPIKTLYGLERIEHLALCGLVHDAQSEALALVGDAIGRRLN
ncbi:hypothetical protein [Acidovorax delafieldii]|uniref:hypothetical protein n=1 Tax=Acidovorax delafieldii TaxID=47920 RepID=UPI003ECE6988